MDLNVKFMLPEAMNPPFLKSDLTDVSDKGCLNFKERAVELFFVEKDNTVYVSKNVKKNV